MPFNAWKLLYVLIPLVQLYHSHAIAKNSVDFSVKPLVCIVKNSGDSCDINVQVQWSSVEPISSCLFQNEIKTVCWIERLKAEKSLDISIKEDMEFTLKNNNNDIYATQVMRINTSEPKKYRRRLRADWNLF